MATMARIILELEFEIDTEVGYTLPDGSKTHGLFDPKEIFFVGMAIERVMAYHR